MKAQYIMQGSTTTKGALVFSTYEKAEEKVGACAKCGKKDLSIIGHMPARKDTFYTVERCDVPRCNMHCRCKGGAS